jgi:hypothetical protein
VRSITWGKYVISYRTIFCSFWFGKYFNLCGLVHYAIDSLRMCVVAVQNKIVAVQRWQRKRCDYKICFVFFSSGSTVRVLEVKIR